MCCGRVASGGKSTDLPKSSAEKKVLSQMFQAHPFQTHPYLTPLSPWRSPPFPFPFLMRTLHERRENLTPPHPSPLPPSTECVTRTKSRDTLHHQKSGVEAYQRSSTGSCTQPGADREDSKTYHVNSYRESQEQ